jgi:hypothetical protein
MRKNPPRAPSTLEAFIVDKPVHSLKDRLQALCEIEIEFEFLLLGANFKSRRTSVAPPIANFHIVRRTMLFDHPSIDGQNDARDREVFSKPGTGSIASPMLRRNDCPSEIWKLRHQNLNPKPFPSAVIRVALRDRT